MKCRRGRWHSHSTNLSVVANAVHSEQSHLSNLWGEFSGEKRRRWPKHAGANAATHATDKTTKGSAYIAAARKPRTLKSPSRLGGIYSKGIPNLKKNPFPDRVG